MPLFGAKSTGEFGGTGGGPLFGTRSTGEFGGTGGGRGGFFC